MRADRTRGLVALLLLLSAGLFAVGTTLERNHHAESGGVEASASPAETQGEAGAEGGTPSEGAAVSEPILGEADHGESLFGLDLESTWLVTAGVALSIGLAVLTVRSTSTAVTIGVVGAGVLFAMLDLREVFHQADASNGGLVVISAALAAMHLTIVALGISIIRREKTTETITD